MYEHYTQKLNKIMVENIYNPKNNINIVEVSTFSFSCTALQNSSKPLPFRADMQIVSSRSLAFNFSSSGLLALSTCLYRFLELNYLIINIKIGKRISSFTLFHTINLGIEDASSSDRTFSTASICCSASGWLQLIVVILII